MDIRILEDIGLTNAEIKVYLALLELGTSTAGPVLSKTGLQNSVVHMTLARLIDKGLASFVKEGKRKHYRAADPKHIMDYIDEKKERFGEILPALIARKKLPKGTETTLFRGKKGIRELLYELLEAGGSEHHTFGSAEKSLMMGDSWWIGYHRRRAAKGIRAKLMFNESLKFWKAEKRYPKAEVRYTKKGFEPLTETIIRNDKVGIIIWTDNPIGILIHSREAAESYDKFFGMMWEKARK